MDSYFYLYYRCILYYICRLIVGVQLRLASMVAECETEIRPPPAAIALKCNEEGKSQRRKLFDRGKRNINLK